MNLMIIYTFFVTFALLELIRCNEERNWDLIFLLKEEKQVPLTNQFSIRLEPTTDFSKMFLSAKTLFPENILPRIFTIVLKLKFLNGITEPGSVLSITDPNSQKRLSLTINVSPGVTDKVILSFFFHPVDGKMISHDVVLPFTNQSDWIIGLSIKDDRLRLFANCLDIKRHFGYQSIKLYSDPNKILFKDGAILNLFHEGDGTKKLMAEVIEFSFANHERKLTILCQRQIDGSGDTIKTNPGHARMGNVLLRAGNKQKQMSEAKGKVDPDQKLRSESDFDEDMSSVTPDTLDYSTSDRTRSKFIKFGNVRNMNKHKVKVKKYASMIPDQKTERTFFQTTSTKTGDRSEEVEPAARFIGNGRPGTKENSDNGSGTTGFTSTLRVEAVGTTPISDIDTTSNSSKTTITVTATKNDGSTILYSKASGSKDRQSSTQKLDDRLTIRTIIEKATNGQERKVLGSTEIEIMNTDRQTTRKAVTESSSKMHGRESTSNAATKLAEINGITTDPTVGKPSENTRITTFENKKLRQWEDSTIRPDVIRTEPINKYSTTLFNITGKVRAGNETKDPLKVKEESELERCKTLLMGDNCKEMKQLRLSIPKPGDKGVKGSKGDRGDQGDIGPQGIQGTCDASSCRNNVVKGDKGEIGSCNVERCISIKGDKGEAGLKGTGGIKGEIGESNGPNIDLIRNIVMSMLNEQIVKIEKMEKGSKGEPGQSNYVKSNNQQTRGFQEKINIAYGSLVFDNKESLEKVSFHLPIGSMVFLLKSDIFLVKVDHLNNIWRSITLESRSKDWLLPGPQTTPSIELARPAYANGSSKRLHLVALTIPTLGDLKSSVYQPGGYTGAAFQCQHIGAINGFGRSMHPLINTDMFNIRFIVNDLYREIPIYNSRGEILANDFQSLLSVKEDLQNEILDFERHSIINNTMSPCVWIGKDLIQEYQDYQANAELKCTNWMSRHPLSKGLVSIPVPFKPMMSDVSLKPRACSLQCHILCIQTEPTV